MEEEAVRLFALHELSHTWSFRFDRATTRLGQCDHRSRTISVSRHLTHKATPDEVTQVLLHEIAHALAGPRAAHGPAGEPLPTPLAIAVVELTRSSQHWNERGGVVSAPTATR